MSDLGQALHALIDALGRSAIPYLIGGSTASGIHGIYRTTLDIDMDIVGELLEQTLLIRQRGR